MPIETTVISTQHPDDPALATLVDDLDRLTADPGRARRMVAAIALAVAITALEVVLAFVFARWPHDPPAERTVATSVVLERASPTPRPTPTATPRPVPTPTPVPLVRATVAPVQRAAPATRSHAGGSGAAPTPVPHPIHSMLPAAAKAAPGAGIALDPGAGIGAGAGSGTGDDAGTGNGSGGTGTGSVNADIPCGYVEFIPSEAPRIVGTTSYEKIQATVHFPDGHTESEDFPYPWVYADYMETDPWSPINVRKPNLVVFAQFPPPGADTRRYPEIVRYVLDHTKPSGGTVLQPCPR